MTKRNIIWLAAVVVVGIVVWIAFGIGWGVLAAAIVLVVSELVERIARQRRRAERGVTDTPSVRDAVVTRRKRR